jgi:hypothetical protein
MQESLLLYFLQYLMEMKHGKDMIAYMIVTNILPVQPLINWNSRGEVNHSILLLPLCNFMSWTVTTLFAPHNGKSVDQLLKAYHLLWRSFVT